MKPINTSIFDFPELIRRGCVYVDKTGILYEIAKPDADGIYYLPRPRRFGKSLMISTLKIPNHEVRQSLEQGYISRLLGKDFQIDNFRFTAEDSAARFVGESRPVYYIGVNYDPKSRTIDDVKAESAVGAEEFAAE